MNHNYSVISWTRAANIRSREFLSLACTPHDEECTQAGMDYIKDGEYECAVLIEQLIRIHGKPPEYAEFFICRNDHEFGPYHEAAIRYVQPNDDMDYDDMSEWQQAEYDKAAAAEAYAFKLESCIPEKWDDIALSELKKAGHHLHIQKEPAKIVKHHGKLIDIKSETA